MAYTLRGRLESRLAAALAPLLGGLRARARAPSLVAALSSRGSCSASGSRSTCRLSPAPSLPARLGCASARPARAGRGHGPRAPRSTSARRLRPLWCSMPEPGFSPRSSATRSSRWLRLSYGEDGGELGRAGTAWRRRRSSSWSPRAGSPGPLNRRVVHLAAGVHEGPLVLGHSQQLVGEPGAVVRGGIVVTADDVTIRDVTVIGGRARHQVDVAERVLLERVHDPRRKARRDQRPARSGHDPRLFDLDARKRIRAGNRHLVHCRPRRRAWSRTACLTGGQEGIFLDSVHATARDNHVRQTTLRGITVTEMAMVAVEGNTVEDALGIGILCSDYSMCDIRGNSHHG